MPANQIVGLLPGVIFVHRKAGYIRQHQSPILARLGLDSEQWLTLTTEFEQHFNTAVGSEHMLQQFKHHTNHQRIRGMAKARALLQSA